MSFGNIDFLRHATARMTSGGASASARADDELDAARGILVSLGLSVAVYAALGVIVLAFIL